MVAGLMPATESAPRVKPEREKSLPNGAQLMTWRAQGRAAREDRRILAHDNRSRRRATWWRWALGWAPKHAHHQGTHTTHRDRAQLCAAHGVPNTGRQWRRLRKALARQGRAS